MAMTVGLAKVAGWQKSGRRQSVSYRPNLKDWVADAQADVDKTNREIKERANRVCVGLSRVSGMFRCEWGSFIW